MTSHMGSMSVDFRTKMEIEATKEVVRLISVETLKSEVPKEEYDIQENVVSRASKNILVIGGSGFIGSHTADALGKKGHKVTILDKDITLAKKDQKMIIGNMMDQDILNSSMEDIDYIYYFAGIADIEEAKSDPYKISN